MICNFSSSSNKTFYTSLSSFQTFLVCVIPLWTPKWNLYTPGSLKYIQQASQNDCLPQQCSTLGMAPWEAVSTSHLISTREIAANVLLSKWAAENEKQHEAICSIIVAIFHSGPKCWTDRHCYPSSHTANIAKKLWYRATSFLQSSSVSSLSDLSVCRLMWFCFHEQKVCKTTFQNFWLPSANLYIYWCKQHMIFLYYKTTKCTWNSEMRYYQSDANAALPCSKLHH